MVGKAGYDSNVNANVENNYQYLKLYINIKSIGHPSLPQHWSQGTPTRSSSDMGLLPDTTQGDCLLGGSSLFHPLEERKVGVETGVDTVQASASAGGRIQAIRGRKDCQVHIPGSRGRQARWRLWKPLSEPVSSWSVHKQ